jgi:two-component system, chemotaxis family, response regulator Rcp1
MASWRDHAAAAGSALDIPADAAAVPRKAMTASRRPARPFRLLLIEHGAPRTASGTLNQPSFARRVVETAAAPHGVQALSGDEILAHRSALLADLIVVDVDMAATGARQLLADLRRDPSLSHVPMIIVAAHASDADILAAYRLHANCCLRRPDDAQAAAVQLETVIRYWLGGAVMLPARPGA